MVSCPDPLSAPLCPSEGSRKVGLHLLFLGTFQEMLPLFPSGITGAREIPIEWAEGLRVGFSHRCSVLLGPLLWEQFSFSSPPWPLHLTFFPTDLPITNPLKEAWPTGPQELVRVRLRGEDFAGRSGSFHGMPPFFLC